MTLESFAKETTKYKNVFYMQKNNEMVQALLPLKRLKKKEKKAKLF